MIENMTAHLALDRRAVLQHIGLLIGAAALPAGALAAPARRARRFLAAPQFALLSAVADTIMPATDSPGALAGMVPAQLDGMLMNWASAETRSNITGALARIDALAMTQKHKHFAALTSAEREAVLRGHDAASLKAVPPPANLPAFSLFSQRNYVADPGYLRLKQLVVTLYYASEAASTQELIYEHVPGKFEPSIKLTPTSRPYQGTGNGL